MVSSDVVSAVVSSDVVSAVVSSDVVNEEPVKITHTSSENRSCRTRTIGNGLDVTVCRSAERVR